MSGDRQLPQAVYDLQEDFRTFRENVIKRLDLLESLLPPEAAREAGIYRREFDIDEFRKGR